MSDPEGEAAAVLRQSSVASSGMMDDYEFDEDDVDDLDDASTPAAAGQGAPEYKVLRPEDIVEEQLRAVEEVNGIFQISPSVAKALLVHCKWNKDRLLELYYSGEQEQLFCDAHVVHPHKLRRTDSAEAQADRECGACLSDYAFKDMACLDCQHYFCLYCWDKHLHTQVAAMTERILCPAKACDCAVDEFTVSRLLKDEKSVKLYKALIARTFVRSNPYVAWCPSPSCGNAVKVLHPGPSIVQCTCNTLFCFGCLQLVHTPIPCPLLKLWLKKCADDSATASWITVNTKECPACNVSTEKNGGCNHMTCRTCKYEYCWICMGKWSDHNGSYYQCNKFKEGESAPGDKKTEGRRALERYLFFFRRYQNHHESNALEARLATAVKKRQEELQAANRSWIEVQYLKDALNVLATCRTVLSFSYAFIFYCNRNAQLDLFELHQSALEQATEQLSELLEKKTELAEAETKGRILDKRSYCQNLRDVLVKFVDEGMGAGTWLLTDGAKDAMRA